MLYDPEAVWARAPIGEPTPEQRFRAEYYAHRHETANLAGSETEPLTNARLLRAQIFARVRMFL
jgi:hypothetical protein